MSNNNVEEEPPVLWENGVEGCGGDEDMFRMMIEKFEELSFTEKMEKLFNSVMEMNFAGIQSETHSLKGILGYIAAKRCEKATIDVMNGAKASDTKTVIETYPTLLIEAKALVIHLAKLLNKTPDVSAIERYDWDRGVKSCGGNDQKFKELLEDFEKFSFYRIMNELHQNMLDFDLAKVGIIANGLKKALGVIAAYESQKIAEELEQAALDCDNENVIECYVILLEEAVAIQTQLGKVLDKTYGLINFEKQEKAVRIKHADKFPLDKPIQRKRTPVCCAKCNIF